jgi:hypothetical protein
MLISQTLLAGRPGPTQLHIPRSCFASSYWQSSAIFAELCAFCGLFSIPADSSVDFCIEQLDSNSPQEIEAFLAARNIDPTVRVFIVSSSSHFLRKIGIVFVLSSIPLLQAYFYSDNEAHVPVLKSLFTCIASIFLRVQTSLLFL